MTRRSLLLLLSLPLIGLCLAQRQGGAVPPSDSLSQDEAVIARHITELSSSSSRVREAAATDLRAIVAKYPSATSDIRDKDTGKAAWQKKIVQTHHGMTEAEVEKILPPLKGNAENGGMWEGQSRSKQYRLDDHWTLTAWYRDSGGMLGVPELRRCERRAGMACPPHFTGRWTIWYVNGQKAEEYELRDGKCDGTLTSFWDNGGKCYEQHYVKGVCEGADTGWYPSGKLDYTAHYKHDKEDGVSTFWYESGQKRGETHYKDGKNDGLDAQWYENGQMKTEMNYHNGVESGLNAAWNEKGEVEYSHQMKDGSVVE